VMTKIYTDTNWFLNFYRKALDDLALLDELAKYKGTLIITRQTINEFLRNRVTTLKGVISEFKKSVDVRPPHTTALLRSFPAHEELKSITEDYKKKSKEVLDYLRQVIEDDKKDPVVQKLLALWDDATVTKLETSDELVDKAFKRKLLGNPPTSPGKHTIGDELIWELLLVNMKEDLVVVTGDRTFLENKALLQEEFSSRTGKTLILITEEFSSALKADGKIPSEKLIDVEKQIGIEKQIAGIKNLPADLMWITKGSGKHAAILCRRIDDLIDAYQVETGNDFSSDQHIIPIKRMIASLILAKCDQIDSLIRDEC
jgi:predicted nucleic acid-binding protein